MYPEPSHSGEICSSKDCNTILRYLYFWRSFYILKSKMTMFSCVKNTYFKLFIWSCRTLYHTIFNVIFILKNPDIIFPSIYRDILTQRTHSKSLKSVPPTLNSYLLWQKKTVPPTLNMFNQYVFDCTTNYIHGKRN